MEVSDIKTIKREINEFISHSDESTIRAIHTFLKSAQSEENWDDTNSDLMASIDRGLKDMEEGKVTAHEEMVKYYCKWLSK